jgi:hypothetical protein
VLALENDGQPYPPNVISRLEVFAQNVERYERPRPAGTPHTAEERSPADAEAGWLPFGG